MLPLFALTYTAARLGLEAQTRSRVSSLKLSAGITKTAEISFPDPFRSQIVSASPGSGRAETSSRREEDLQKIGAGWETQPAD